MNEIDTLNLNQAKELNDLGCYQFITPSQETIDIIIMKSFQFLKDIFVELDYNNRKSLASITTTNPNVSSTDKVCLEIRPLMRRYPVSITQANKSIVHIIKNPAYKARNFKLYSFSNSEYKRYSKYVKSLFKKCEYFCLYYSVYTFDNATLSIKRDGTPYPPYQNMISAANAFGTQRLVADFDFKDIPESDVLKSFDELKALGLIPSKIIYSGHGYQCVFILDKFSTDLNLQLKFTNYLLDKGFIVDNKIKDCARIMRLPFFFNCKEYGKEEYVTTGNAKAIPTYIYEENDYVIKLDALAPLLDTHTNVNKKTTAPTKSNSTYSFFEPYALGCLNDNTPITKDVLRFLEYTYPMLSFQNMPTTIMIMLLGYQKGQANNVTMYLVAYFKEQGYSITTIIDVIDILKELDSFSYRWSELETELTVKRFYYEYCDGPSYSIYKANKLEVFGLMEPSSAYDNSLKIYNFIPEALEYYGTTGFFAYITLLFWSDMTYRRNFSIDELSVLTGKSARTLYRVLKPFVRTSNVQNYEYYLIDKSANSNVLYNSMIHSPLEKEGFFTISYKSMDILIDLVKDNQINTTTFALAVLLKKYSFGTDLTNISQNSLAKILGFKTQGTLSRELHKLEQLNLISISTKSINKFQTKNTYTILY